MKLCRTCDITKLNPKFLFCLDSPFEDLSHVQYLCHMWSTMRRRKLCFLTIITGCALGFAAKMPWTIPQLFRQQQESPLSPTMNDGCFQTPPLPWSTLMSQCWWATILTPTITNGLLYKHTPSSGWGFQTHTVLLHTNVTGRTILHWKRNRSNNLQSCFDLGLFC